MKELFINLLLVTIALTCTSKADETIDIMQAVIDASATSPKTSEVQIEKKRYRETGVTKKNSSQASKKTINKESIPESELFDVTAQLPKDSVGKYVYGNLVFNGVCHNEDGTVDIMMIAKNLRGFWINTRNPNIVNKFEGLKYGAKLNISKETPFRILHKGAAATYDIEMPYLD
jgi:hypothetical protein